MAGEEVFWVFFLLSIVAYCFSRTPVSYAAVVLFYVVMPVGLPINRRQEDLDTGEGSRNELVIKSGVA